MKALALLLICPVAWASEPQPDYVPHTVGIHLVSAHTKPGEPTPYNNTNPGIYARWGKPTSGPVAGIYYNSQRKTTVYGAWAWETEPNKYGLSFGASLGLATGYRYAPVIPFATGSIALQIGQAKARLSFMPPVKKADAAGAAHLSAEWGFK